jgi:D-sedoheptulose 7-phosphate isomerase
MKEFKLKRKVYQEQAEEMRKISSELGEVLAENLQGALPAISLTGHSSLTTAFMNDSEPELIFAQQVNGYGKPGDVYLGISTSGNSKNVLYAAVTAKSKGLMVIGLTGQRENRLMKYADVCIRVPETETYKIQELHLPVYHCLCMMLEDKFFG